MCVCLRDIKEEIEMSLKCTEIDFSNIPIYLMIKKHIALTFKILFLGKAIESGSDPSPLKQQKIKETQFIWLKH